MCFQMGTHSAVEYRFGTFLQDASGLYSRTCDGSSGWQDAGNNDRIDIALVAGFAWAQSTSLSKISTSSSTRMTMLQFGKAENASRAA